MASPVNLVNTAATDRFLLLLSSLSTTASHLSAFFGSLWVLCLWSVGAHRQWHPILIIYQQYEGIYRVYNNSRGMGLICSLLGAKGDIISPHSEARVWARRWRRWSRAARGVSEWTESLKRVFIHYEWAVRPSVPACNSSLALKW